MKRRNSSNALLVELLIVILFFMLGCVILIRVFGKASQMTDDSRVITGALAQAQTVADTLYASDGSEEMLEQMGFVPDEDRNGDWFCAGDDWQLRVTIRDEQQADGRVRRMVTAAYRGEEVLVTLPCSRYTAKP